MVKERIPWIPYPCLFPFLVLISFLYAGCIRFRNLLFDLSLLKAERVDVPVISVGNITVGGTGKTPLVLRVAEEAVRRGSKPGVVARGYGGVGDGGLNDESRMLLKCLPGLALAQNPDRRRGARMLIEEHGIDLIVMDDGFQHRGLRREVDVVVLDAMLAFGFGRVLPAGLLREPLANLRRAHAFVLSRCDQADAGQVERIEGRLEAVAPRVPRFRTVHAPSRLERVDSSLSEAVGALDGEKVYLFSGIANPQAFELTIKALGADVLGHTVFPDHHLYTEEDVRRIQRQAEVCGADRMITTAKDAVKLDPFPEAADFWVLEIGVSFLEREDEFWELIFNPAKSPST
ncbi:MAG: tetraacyldisaccharide 4'-kinase [Planctomycetota bacterium]|jgi:tetraacyldisaccharide 4'-kinase